LAIGGDHQISVGSSILIGTVGIAVEVMKKGEPNLIENMYNQVGQTNQEMIEAGIEAAGCFPIRLRDKSIGVMWVFYERPHRFPGSEVDALRLYVNQVAIAYDNARRMKELDHLRKAAGKLASVAEVKKVLQQIVESARDVFEADSAVIWSYDASRHVFLPNELVADGVAPDILDQFKKDTPRLDGTAVTIMQRGYLAVTNIEDAKYAYLKAPVPRLRHAIAVKSYQGIALKVEGESLGVLYVNHQQLRGFDEEDETTLETLAYDAALALKKARLLARLKRGHEAARIIAEASVLENLQATLNAIAKGTQDALGCDAVTLYTYDQEKNEIGFPPAMAGVKLENEVVKHKYVARDSIIYKILGHDKMYVLEDVSSDPAARNRPFVKRENIKSLVSLSLSVSNHKVGVMFVNYRNPHHFTEEECGDIELFADQAAVAIRNAQLYEDATKTTNYLQAFYDASKAVSGTLALDEILGRITKQAQLITGSAGGPKARLSYLAMVKENKLKIMSAFPRRFLPDLQRATDNIDFEYDKQIGIMGCAVKLGKAQLVDDVSIHPQYIPGDPYTKSELAVPIKSGERVMGVINVEHSDFGAFDEDDVRALEALAAQAAIAIQYAQQYEELKQTKGLVGARTALAWMGMASSAWWHATGNQAQSIREQIDLLRRDLSHSVPAQKYAQIDDRLSLIQELTRQIQEKPITPPLSAEEGAISVSVNELIRERTKRLWESEPYKSTHLKLNLTLEDKATAHASPEWLRRAFDILIDNAVGAMSDTPQKNMAISTKQNHNRIEIYVNDTGKGIPEDILPILLQTPIDKPKGVEGMGMGLLMAQAIVETYSGNIKVASTSPAGTTMLVSLPLET
jgi:GAF domain-containing protein